MAKIFLSVPVLDKPELQMMYSSYQAMLSCKEHQVRVYFNENDSLISRVRNVHISAFLNEYTDCEYFVSIDSDLEIVNCHPSNNIFSKLISWNKDFVGGLYALKQQKTKPLCASVPLSDDYSRDNIPFNSGLIEMRWLSSGCWCIKREALEKLVEAYPELAYTGDDNVAGKSIYGLCIPQIFEFEENGKKYKKYMSEDWALCERWRKIGGEIYADTSIVLKHIGKTYHSLWDLDIKIVKKNEPNSIPNLDQAKIAKNSRSKSLPPPGFDL